MADSLQTDPDGFWADKVPCWNLRDCPPEACRQCEAYLDQSRPCWEQDALCKKLLGLDTCKSCEVSRRYVRFRKDL